MSVLRKLTNSMTVEQLIDELNQFSPDAVVVFSCDYGDRCHTQQALTITDVEPLEGGRHVEETAYSQSGLAIEGDEYDEPRESEEDLPEVIVLS